MAGTKEKPCKTCKYNDFKEYIKSAIDVCYLCFEGSHHESNDSLKATSLPDCEGKQGADGRETP